MIHKRESTGVKFFNYLNASIEYSKDIEDSYENIEEFNPNKKTKNIKCIS